MPVPLSLLPPTSWIKLIAYNWQLIHPHNQQPDTLAGKGWISTRAYYPFWLTFWRSHFDDSYGVVRLTTPERQCSQIDNTHAKMTLSVWWHREFPTPPAISMFIYWSADVLPEHRTRPSIPFNTLLSVNPSHVDSDSVKISRWWLPFPEFEARTINRMRF